MVCILSLSLLDGLDIGGWAGEQATTSMYEATIECVLDTLQSNSKQRVREHYNDTGKRP